MAKGKVLALDFGTKRIGVAISDADRVIAFPRGFLEAKPVDAFLAHLGELILAEKIEEIVMGEALGSENEETDMSMRSHALGEKLTAKFGVKVHYIDEHQSSREALAKIPFRKDRRRKGEKDSIAAQVILMRWIGA
jgi:putative Holliday junction resolvase